MADAGDPLGGSQEILKALKELTINQYPDYATTTVLALLPSCLTPKFEHGQERPPEEKDFHKFQVETPDKIFLIRVVLEQLIDPNLLKDTEEGLQPPSKDGDYTNVSKVVTNPDFLLQFFLLLGENVTKCDWNTENSIRYCNDILKIVLEVHKCNTAAEVLMSLKMEKDMLLALRPKLLAKEWKFYPAAVSCYSWLLKMMTYPNLDKYVNDVMPTALLLVDDFITENRIIGLNCLKYIVQNTDSVQFHNVLVKALEPLLLVRDAQLIAAVLPCYMVVLSDVEESEPFDSTMKVLDWSALDNLMEGVLGNMELEHVIALRDVYIGELQHVVSCVGIRVIRWSRRLLRVIAEYLEVARNHSDLKTILACLQALESYLRLSKRVVHLYASNVLFLLFKTLYFLTASDLAEKFLTDAVVSCLNLVLAGLSEQEKQHLKSVLATRLTEREQCCSFLSFLNKVF